MRSISKLLGCITIFFLIVGLFWRVQKETERANFAEREVGIQADVIAKQVFHFNRFNKISAYTSNLNSLINAGTEKKVIQYREILRNEKTCDLPVPADVAGGLLEYAYRLRTSAMHAAPNGLDHPDINPASSSSLTYCQAVMWVGPLLAAIEKANNQLSGVRDIEYIRAAQ
ncbi:hypothetical protein WMR32_005262 [Klebsiella oxytoca]|nr:hypothetical protein [Klebsiella oxytoca]HEJ8155952.1 hypothetical protein [Klebsiella oxytoca]